MTRILRLVLAATLLATLTAATTRECTGAGGHAPQRADSDAVRFVARSSAFRVHVRAVIGAKVIRDDPTVVDDNGWRSDLYQVKPTDFIELRVTLMDIGHGWVFCAIEDKNGHEITSDQAETPDESVKCILAPLTAKGPS